MEDDSDYYEDVQESSTIIPYELLDEKSQKEIESECITFVNIEIPFPQPTKIVLSLEKLSEIFREQMRKKYVDC